MTDPIQVDELDHGVFALSDPLGCRSYLVVGERRAALVDTMSGVGDVRAVAKALAGGQPVDVLLTYRHPDHASGAYRFERVAMTAGEDGHWEETEKNASAFCVAALDGGLIETANVWPVRPQRRPRVTHVGEKDRLDLGGLSLTRVLLPGRTNASAGYLCPERAALFSGDAVRPIMCLRFEESLPLSAWRRTLAKMEGARLRALLHGSSRARVLQGRPRELRQGGALCPGRPGLCVAARHRGQLDRHLPPVPLQNL